MTERQVIERGSAHGALTSLGLAKIRRATVIFGLIGAALLLAIGISAYRVLRLSFQESLAADLTTVRDADVTALRLWLDENARTARLAARDPRIVEVARALTEVSRRSPDDRASLTESPLQDEARRILQPICEAHGFQGYAVIEDRRVLTAWSPSLVGRTIRAHPQRIRDELIQGKTVISKPTTFSLAAEGTAPESATAVLIAIASPVIVEEEHVISVVFLEPPGEEFTRILQVGQLGTTGETYAFDASGLLLSQSRFDEQLKAIGLLPRRAGAASPLRVEIRDPGVNLVEGETSETPRAEQPLTRMAADCVQGRAGVDVEGYRDYRGVRVIGSWVWLEDYGFGVATEMDAREAYRPFRLLYLTFGAIFALLVVSVLALVVYQRVTAHLRRRMEKIERLGQYELVERLGAGGMGQVFRARHALLRRPTAIKLVHPDTTEQGKQRFEREVQITSQLTHPNTIAVYDYGRTPSGVFYYVMELVEGFDLSTLVKRHGPLPPGRLIHLMTQVCGSVAEAHGLGLVHRDLKPGNIMVCERGGQPDHVKVLDFGLVKDVSGEGDATELTATSAVMGTPLYVAPEQIETPQHIDHRADIYSLGCVMYFLSTGSHVFPDRTAIQVISDHVRTPPEPPSKRAPVPDDLERVILRCLEKAPGERYRSALDLRAALSVCRHAGDWTDGEAAAWWSVHRDEAQAADRVEVGRREIGFAETIPVGREEG